MSNTGQVAWYDGLLDKQRMTARDYATTTIPYFRYDIRDDWKIDLITNEKGEHAVALQSPDPVTTPILLTFSDEAAAVRFFYGVQRKADHSDLISSRLDSLAIEAQALGRSYPSYLADMTKESFRRCYNLGSFVFGREVLNSLQRIAHAFNVKAGHVPKRDKKHRG